MKKIFIFCAGIIIWFTGCEQHDPANLTSALFDQTSGKFSNVTIGPDSLTIQTGFQDSIGTLPVFFAGKYKTEEAFAVFKFANPGRSIIDSLITAILTVTVRSAWRDGTFGFALYPTISDWDNGIRLNPDTFLTGLGSPIQVVSPDTSAFSVLTFTVPAGILTSWGDYGAFLLKNSDQGGGMLLLSSENTSSPPSLKLVTRNKTAGVDTTTIQSRTGTFVMTGVPENVPILADGYAEGYILSVAVPALDNQPAPVNSARLSFTMGQSLFSATSIPVKLEQLSKPFTSVADVDTSYVSAIDLTLLPGVTDYSVDISKFIDSWHNFGKSNHGVLVRTTTIGTSPDYAVLTPGDSLTIFYTQLPEVP